MQTHTGRVLVALVATDDKNIEQVKKCAVISTCTLTLFHIPAHPHCKQIMIATILLSKLLTI